MPQAPVQGGTGDAVRISRGRESVGCGKSGISRYREVRGPESVVPGREPGRGLLVYLRPQHSASISGGHQMPSTICIWIFGSINEPWIRKSFSLGLLTYTFSSHIGITLNLTRLVEASMAIR